MRFETLLSESLQRLESAGLLREPEDGIIRRQVELAAVELGFQLLDASSNDYLGLAGAHVSRETLGHAGAAASRLIYGTAKEHVRLESALAAWVGAESALLFASAYSANVGLMSALGVDESVIVSDAANHASLIDGSRLAKARVVVVPHLDLGAIGAALRDHRHARACWVVTESYFSMDGDGPDLPAIRELCDEHDACLIIDEAHALGVFGPNGAGRCAELGLRADIVVGALGKAVGTHGGFVAGSRELRRFLWNRARSFVFSTAPSPQHAGLTGRHVELTQQAHHERLRLAANVDQLRARLAASGLAVVPGSFGPIVSVVLGDNQRALSAAARLRAVGILVQAIRPPTVRDGAARLRLTVKATFTEIDVDRLARATEAACRE
jgi:8-amino-7-oxononanoate synthase